MGIAQFGYLIWTVTALTENSVGTFWVRSRDAGLIPVEYTVTMLGTGGAPYN